MNDFLFLTASFAGCTLLGAIVATKFWSVRVKTALQRLHKVELERNVLVDRLIKIDRVFNAAVASPREARDEAKVAETNAETQIEKTTDAEQ